MSIVVNTVNRIEQTLANIKQYQTKFY